MADAVISINSDICQKTLWSEKIEKKLNETMELCDKKTKEMGREAKKYSILSTIINYGSALNDAAIAAALFARPYDATTTKIISATALILSALTEFTGLILNFNEKSIFYKESSIKYRKITREIELILYKEKDCRTVDPYEFITKINEKMDEIEETIFRMNNSAGK